MSLDEDMWEAGFSDEESYIEYLMDEAEEYFAKQEQYDNDYDSYDQSDDDEEEETEGDYGQYNDFTGYYQFSEEEEEIKKNAVSYEVAMDFIYNNIDRHTNGISVEEDFDSYYFYKDDGNGGNLMEKLGVFDNAGNFYDGIAPVLVEATKTSIWIEAIKDYVEISYGGKWGFINLEGDFVVSPTYDCLSPFKGEIAAFCIGAYLEEKDDFYVQMGGTWGLINRFGKEILPAKYVQVRVLSDTIAAANVGGDRTIYPFASGGLWGLFDKDGEQISEFKYTRIYGYIEDEVVFNIGGKEKGYGENAHEIVDGVWGMLDKNGHEIGEPIPAANIREFKYKYETTRKSKESILL